MQPADPMRPIPTRWEPPVCRRPDHRESRKNPMSRNVQRTAPERPRQAQRNHRTSHPPCRRRHPSKPRHLPRRPGRDRRRKTPFRRPHAHHPHHPHQPQRLPIRLAEPQARDSDGALVGAATRRSRGFCPVAPVGVGVGRPHFVVRTRIIRIIHISRNDRRSGLLNLRRGTRTEREVCPGADPIRFAEPQARDSDGARSMPRSRSPVPGKPQAPLVRGSETGMLRMLRQMSRHRRPLLERGHRGTPAHQSAHASSCLHLPYGCLSIDDDGMRSPQANRLPLPHRQRRQPRRLPWPVP